LTSASGSAIQMADHIERKSVERDEGLDRYLEDV
jgi:hypothetical protein